MKCTKCECFGHNSRTSKGGLTTKEKRENGEPVIIRNPKVRDQPNAAKAVTTATKEDDINISQSTINYK